MGIVDWKVIEGRSTLRHTKGPQRREALWSDGKMETADAVRRTKLSREEIRKEASKEPQRHVMNNVKHPVKYLVMSPVRKPAQRAGRKPGKVGAGGSLDCISKKGKGWL